MTNEDTTLDEQSQNTDLELEDNLEQSSVDENIEDVEINDETTEETTEETNDDSNTVDHDTLNNLSDEEFIEFLTSGKVKGIVPEDNSTKDGDDKDKNNGTLTTSSSDKSSGSISDNETDGSSDGSGRGGKAVRKSSEDGSKKSVEGENSHDKSQSNTKEIDYKAVYETIFKPFKANGKEIAPRTEQDVISLMQMGANYTKKMQIMAPMRKTFESLNKAKIDNDELNFLIDVHNGDKEAIKKLLEKHKVDPMELDMDSTNYVPKNNLVSDEDVEYSNILEDIQSSIPKIHEIINTKWDGESKNELLKNPKLMEALHEEIQMGRFDVVQERLEIEKTFGKYKGMSDVQAYIDVVQTMIKENFFNKANTREKPTNTPKKSIPDKSKAAPNRSTKAISSGTTITPADIFNMSEEELNRLSI